MKALNLMGQRYGWLTPISVTTVKSKRVWLCTCDCGKSVSACTGDLQSGKVISCGCAKKEFNLKHGHSGTQVYRAWKNMRTRCLNPNFQQYKDYGGRGITICPEWEDFATFMRDMGEPAQGLTLDRIDVNGHYSRDNCRWITRAEQNRNKRKRGV